MTVEDAKQQVMGAVYLYGNYVTGISSRSSAEVSAIFMQALDALIDAVKAESTLAVPPSHSDSALDERRDER